MQQLSKELDDHGLQLSTELQRLQRRHAELGNQSSGHIDRIKQAIDLRNTYYDHKTEIEATLNHCQNRMNELKKSKESLDGKFTDYKVPKITV